MRQRRIFVIVCILALALGAEYFLHHSASAGRRTHADESSGAEASQATPTTDSASIVHKQPPHRVAASTSTAPLPPPGTPLKDAYDELAARARSGDRAASVRLFHDTARCRYVDALRQRYSYALPLLKRWTQAHKDDPDDQGGIRPGLSKDEMTWLEQAEPMCADADPESSRSSPEWMSIAAQQGDAEAIDCYLNLDFINVNDALQHPQWLADFQRVAPELAFNAVANGDWKAVSMLSLAYSGIGMSSWLGQTLAPDVQQAYRYAYLLELGGSTFQEDFVKTAEKQLTAKQIAAARAWANEVFATRFHGERMYAGAIKPICPNPIALQN